MKFSMITISFFLAILCLTHVLLGANTCPTSVLPEYAHIQPGNIVAAYFASWDKYGNYKISDIEPIAHKLTHIIYAFAKPDADTGTCVLSDSWADVGANFEHRKKVGGHFSQLLQLKQKFPHLKILLSIGGGTYSDNFAEIARKGYLKKFAKSAVKLLDHYEYHFEHTYHGSLHRHLFEYPELFDGIDLDWEWKNNNPTEEQLQAYLQLVSLLRAKLTKRSRHVGKKSILTCAIQVNKKIIDALPFQKLTPIVDWFHVMTYNFGGPASAGVSMNAPICNQWSDNSIDGSLNRLMAVGVAPNKIVLGIPLYGYVFDKTRPKLGSVFQRTQKTRSLRYDQIKEQYLNNGACYKKWHAKSHVPYAYCPVDQVFVSYDDEQSVQAKVAYAYKKRLKGVFVWRLSGDDKNHSLIRAIENMH